MHKALHELIRWIDDISVACIGVFLTGTIVRQRRYEPQAWNVPVVLPQALLEYLRNVCGQVLIYNILLLLIIVFDTNCEETQNGIVMLVVTH